MCEIQGLSSNPSEAYQQGFRDGRAETLHAEELAATKERLVMSSKIEKQFICVLNTFHDCSYRRSYSRGCDLRVVDEFATATCPHRFEATVLAAAEKEESPVSDVQQPQLEMVVE